MSKLLRPIAFAIAMLIVAGQPSSAAGGAGDVKGLGGGWASIAPATSAKFVHFSFSAHTGPQGDFGQVQFTISDELGFPLDVSATVDCLNTLVLPPVKAAWFSGVVTKVDDPTGFWMISPGNRLYFQIVDGGDPSSRPVDDFFVFRDLEVSCKLITPFLEPPDVTQGNILISTN